MADMVKYKMIVYSNYVEGQEKEYYDWYVGQHIHDMLNIPGFVGCSWHRVSEHQQTGTREDKKFKYVMIWDIETDDIDQVFAQIIAAREAGKITYSPAFDRGTYCTVCEEETQYVTAERIQGKSAEEVKALSVMAK